MEQYQVFKRTANYYETDKMQVVHHSNYVRYLEECRMDFMRQLNIDYRELEDKGVMIPVLSVECNYKAPVRFEDGCCGAVRMDAGTEDGREYRGYDSRGTFLGIYTYEQEKDRLKPRKLFISGECR